MGIRVVKEPLENIQLSRVDSNHDLPGPKPSALPLELRLHISNPHYLVPVRQPNRALADHRIAAHIKRSISTRLATGPDRRHLLHPRPRQQEVIAATLTHVHHDDLLSEVKCNAAQGEGFEPPTIRFRAGCSSI